jgi:heme/copper-type cytochrome/quinol oxidase subunit 1
MVVWLVLATVSGVRLSVSPRLMMILFTLGILAIAMTPVIYVLHEVHSAQHRMAFTWMMGFGNGLAAAPLSLALLVGVLTAGRGSVPEGARPERAALVFSVLLFGVGGIIGFMISGSNTIVPAHYHGSIVGITMAFMGLTYHLLPRMGFGPVPQRLAFVQPFVFGTGQLMHVFGLAFSGGHGVQRKTAGSAQGLENLPEILGMAFMGLGGLVAIIGGVLFLVVVYRSVTGGRGGRLQNMQSQD